MIRKKLHALPILFVLSALTATPAHALDFIEAFVASLALSTGVDFTSNNGNEAKRAQIEQLRADAAEYFVHESSVPGPALNQVLTEMKKRIVAGNPGIDLSKIDDHELAKELLIALPDGTQ